MLSNDINTNEFVRKDVYEANQRALMAEIKLGNAEILKRFDQLSIEVNGRIDKLEMKTDKRFNELETKIEVINSRLDGLDARISDTHTYMGWGIAFIGIIVAIAVVALPVSEFFRKIFKPSINLEDIKTLVATEVEQILTARLGRNSGV